MKTADIVIGEDYALAEAWQWKRGEAKRVTVTATRVPRRYWTDYHQRTKNDGVRVQLPTGKATVAIPADIRQPWAEYDAVRQAADAALKLELSRKESLALRLIDDLRGLLPVGYEFGSGVLPSQRRDGTYTRRPTFGSHKELLDLLTAAYEFGTRRS